MLADRLIEETLFDPGCVEVGRDHTLRWAIGLQEQPAADGAPGIRLSGESVYVITGAAGGIVSAIVADLAAHGGGGTFHLLDRAPAPDPDDVDLRAFVNSRDGLKADLIARARATGQKVTPVTIEKELARIERRAMAAAAIAAVRAAGGRARYHSVDVTDGAAVTDVVREIAAAHSRIDVLVHAAGLQNSRRLPDKPPDEHDAVFDVKSDGWFHLMRAIGDLPVGATVAFSSVAGRFGHLGQTDYTAGNDLLCKLTSNLRRTRPHTRGIALDWSPWAGIGMATRGSIPTQMAAMGIDMLAPSAGIATLRHELTTGGTRGEAVVGGALGVMTAEFDRTGGLDVDRGALPTRGPVAGRVTGMGIWSGLTVEITLDPAASDSEASDPAAHDPAAHDPAALNAAALRPAALHPAALNAAAALRPAAQPPPFGGPVAGTMVLPDATVVDLFVQVARLPVPDRHVGAVTDIDVCEPVRLHSGEPTTLTIRATLMPAEDALVAHCELARSRRHTDRSDPHVTVHATGLVRLDEAPRRRSPSGPTVGR